MPTYIKHKCPCCGSCIIKTGSLLPNKEVTAISIWCARCGTYSPDKSKLNPFIHEIKEEEEQEEEKALPKYYPIKYV